MSKINFEELFPKYSITKYPITRYTSESNIIDEELIDEELIDEELIEINFRNYSWSFTSNGISLKGMQDVHNSIDYIEDFLKLNKFVTHTAFTRFNNVFEHVKRGIDIHIDHDCYFILVNGDYGFKCNSDELLSKLKEILDIELRNKPIYNQ
jgi:hypothetical protein